MLILYSKNKDDMGKSPNRPARKIINFKGIEKIFINPDFYVIYPFIFYPKRLKYKVRLLCFSKINQILLEKGQ